MLFLLHGLFIPSWCLKQCDPSSGLAQTLVFPVELIPQVALLSAASEVLLVNCQVQVIGLQRCSQKKQKWGSRKGAAEKSQCNSAFSTYLLYTVGAPSCPAGPLRGRLSAHEDDGKPDAYPTIRCWWRLPSGILILLLPDCALSWQMCSWLFGEGSDDLDKLEFPWKGPSQLHLKLELCQRNVFVLIYLHVCTHLYSFS